MIREKIDASQERSLITLAITNTEFLKEIHPLCKPEFLKSSYARVVWGWISQYYQTYSSAPGPDIQDIYVKRKLDLDEDEQAIALFLSSLSEEYDRELHNVPRLIDEAKSWLDYRSVEVLRDALTDHLSRKDISGAQDSIATYTKIERIKTETVDVLQDTDKAISSFLDEDEILFRYPGAAGAVIGPRCRGDFVCWLGPMKGAKSFWLGEDAKQGLFSGCNVLLIDLEMEQKQRIRRFWTSLMKKPRTSRKVIIPRFVETDESTEEDMQWEVECEEREMEGIVAEECSFREFEKKFQKYFRRGSLKLQNMSTLSVKELGTILDNLEFYDKWVPDMVVIDYPKLMWSPVKGEPRFKIGDIFQSLRAMALSRKICISVAWQATRGGIYEDLTLEHVSEDISVAQHVTSLIGINSTKEEKSKGIFRLAQLATRDEDPVFEQAVVLGCLNLGSPLLDSRFKSEVRLDNIKKKK